MNQEAAPSAEVLEFLETNRTMTLATATSTGIPRATTLTYVNEGLNLFFCTRPDTISARHIEQNPAISFAISRANEDWSVVQGIQGDGEASVLLSPDEISRVTSRYQTKFPFLKTLSTGNISIFRISPTSVEYISNVKGPGSRSSQQLLVDYDREMVFNVFRDLPQQQVESVAGRLETVRVDGGTVIVRQGAPADKFFIVVDGAVDVIREVGDEERHVAQLRSGQFFGEMAILRDTPRTATVRAAVPSTLLEMDRDTFRSLVAQSLSTTENFDELIQQRMAELAQVR